MRVPGFALWKKMMHSNVSSGQLSHKKTIKSASSGGCCDNVWSGSARPGRCSLINKIRPSGVGGYLTGMPWVGGLAHIVLILRGQQDIYCYEVLNITDWASYPQSQCGDKSVFYLIIVHTMFYCVISVVVLVEWLVRAGSVAISS